MIPTIELRPAALRPGDLIRVRFGSAGTQVARVWCDYGSYVIAHKWRDAPRTWTRNPVQVNACDILGPANPHSAAAQHAREAVQP